MLVSRSKTPFNLTLSGITNDDVDLSVDALKAVTLPLLRRFGVAEEGRLELTVLIDFSSTFELWRGSREQKRARLITCGCFNTLYCRLSPLTKPLYMPWKVKRRGASPGGGGLVDFMCPIVRELKPINFTEPGLIKRIRGNAYCTKVSPQIANRVAESSRGGRGRRASRKPLYLALVVFSETASIMCSRIIGR